VTDLVMPGLNGPQVIDLLRQDGRAPHVLFISGYAPVTVIQREITGRAGKKRTRSAGPAVIRD
jgi:CheY-like chemotaxis protein